VLVFVNVNLVCSSTNGSDGISLSILKRANATPEGCNCSAGYGCVNGVCVVLQQATSSNCSRTDFCWLSLTYKTSNGHQQTCPNNPGGGTNCQPIACDAPDPCN
jgi:hypothetical protein